MFYNLSYGSVVLMVILEHVDSLQFSKSYFLTNFYVTSSLLLISQASSTASHDSKWDWITAWTGLKNFGPSERFLNTQYQKLIQNQLHDKFEVFQAGSSQSASYNITCNFGSPHMSSLPHAFLHAQNINRSSQ